MPKGTVNGEPYSVPEGYEIITTDEKRKGFLALQLLSHLDRSPAGRHKGDVESEDPSGVSQGNPLLPPGKHIGYTLSGLLHIVVPDDVDDPAKWYVLAHE